MCGFPRDVSFAGVRSSSNADPETLSHAIKKESFHARKKT
jgi:hypothetical protein